MNAEILQFQIGPIPPNLPLERHLFRDRFDYDVKFDMRLPTEHGGAGTTFSPKPTVPVASWLLARLALILGDRFQESIAINEDQEWVVEFLGMRDEEVLGPVRLTFASNGYVRAMFQAADVVQTEALYVGIRNALFSAPAKLGAVSVEFQDGNPFGWRNQQYLGQITPEFNAAELVDKLVTGEFVQKLPDDRVENCPIHVDKIAGMLSDPKKPVGAKQVRYLQSASFGDTKAWIFKVSRRNLYAVVVWRSKQNPEIEVVG